MTTGSTGSASGTGSTGSAGSASGTGSTGSTGTGSGSTGSAGSAGSVGLRPMTDADLALVRRWMAEPHVARWYVAGSTAEAELDDVRGSLRGDQPVEMLIAEEDGRPVGWCQWYRCDADPDWAADVGAAPSDAGIDYAIGERRAVGRGVGTSMVAQLVRHVRRHLPEAGIFADPEAANASSRRVLEKNGFALVAERALPSEATEDPMAVYRLSPDGH